MNRLIIVILISCFSIHSIAQDVKLDIAQKVATNWYYNKARAASLKSATITKTKEYKYRGKTNFYIFSFEEGGFVIVSANYAAEPILGYGFKGKVPENIDNPAIKSWFDNYARQIDTLNYCKLKSHTVNPKWQEILDNNYLKSANEGVEPLLTTAWDQGWPYNAMCPEEPNGPGGHAWAGCVAIALSQIMNYHKWPERGAGKLYYLSKLSKNVTVSFSDEFFSWENIPDTINEYNNDVAKLIFNAGVGTGSQYSASSTSVGTWVTSSPEGQILQKLPMEIALSSFFRYNYDSIYARQKTTDVYDDEWIYLLKTEINKRRPIYLQGEDINGISKHAWVCDGYDSDDYFHFNLGWGGLFNGFYYISKVAGFGFDFSQNQIAILGIMPDSTSFFVDQNMELSGTISPDGNIVIPRGITLTLNQGCNLKMKENTKIISLGVLKSLGTIDNIVKISSTDSLSRWKGIWHDDSYLTYYNIIDVQDTNIFYNTEISNSSSDGLNLAGLWEQYTVIDNCQIKNNTGRGLYAQTSPMTLINNSFQGNKEGIFIMNPYSKIEQNTFDETLIFIGKFGSIEFNRNIVRNNSTLRFRGQELDFKSFNFKKNIFHGNEFAVICDLTSGNFINNLFVNNSIAFQSIDSRNILANNTFSNNKIALDFKKGMNVSIVESTIGSGTDTLLNNIIYNNFDNIIIGSSTLPIIDNCIIQNGINGIINNTSFDLNQINLDKIIDGDPKFLNPNSIIGLDTSSYYNFDWNINSNSAALDYLSGDTIGLRLPLTDLNDNPRLNRELDLGAYESVMPPTLSPVIIQNPESKRVCEGFETIISTRIKGDSIQYKWFHNSEYIENANNDSLIFIAVSNKNEGSYYCVAYNNYGSDTTSVADIEISKTKPFYLGELQGPDTIIWWQDSVIYSVNNNPDTKYTWDFSGNKITSISNNLQVNVPEIDSIVQIKIFSENLCGIVDSLQKSVVIKPFSPKEPYGILYGPSVVLRGETVKYFYDPGVFKLENVYIHPYGFEWSNQGYYVSDYASENSVFIVHWYKYSDFSGRFFEGEDIVLPIDVVESINQLPIITCTKKIISEENIFICSINPLKAANSYEWIWPQGLIPISDTNSSEIRFSLKNDYKGGILKVRGINSNWRGPYYELKINKNIPSNVDLFHEKTLDIKVFPNPVSNELFIENTGSSEKLNFEIINNIGQVVFSGVITEKAKVQTSSLAPGIYLIKFTDSIASKSIKFIKK